MMGIETPRTVSGGNLCPLPDRIHYDGD